MPISRRPTDGAGYEVRDEDISFIGLGDEALPLLAQRRAPLGMSEGDYKFMCDAVANALSREGILDADVRLQGSSAHFFSSWHKLMPYSAEDVANLLRQRTGRVPERYLCEPIVTTISHQWPPEQNRPRRRPFDTLFRVGLDAAGSDYDLQISSDQMIEITAQELRERGFDPSRMMRNDPHYDFVIKEYAEVFFPHMGLACGRVAERVGRNVTWALFPSDGPKRHDSDPRLSSHFQPSDWVIMQPMLQEEVAS